MRFDTDEPIGSPGQGSVADSELARLLDAAIDGLRARRRTFTEEEALTAVWEAGYDVSAQSEARFALAREADGPHQRHWRLTEQTLANDRLLNALSSGDWDGRDLDDQLVTLGEVDGARYVFCPLDPRFVLGPTGVLDLADAEQNIDLADDVRKELDGLAPAFLERWRDHGGAPWTVRQITESVRDLGFSRGEERAAWLLVRAWLLTLSSVIRVGQDYWVPVDQTPRLPTRSRVQVLPVSPTDMPPGPICDVDSERSTLTRAASDEPSLTAERLVPSGEMLTPHSVWTVALRTVHLVEGFIPVPAYARASYPARSNGEGEVTVLRGLWFADAERLWLWLDRAHDRLYGLGLADRLAWCEAGDVLRVEWASDVVVLRVTGHDDVVQREELRLVDVEALAALRGGLGETYRRSVQSILTGEPNGLSFADLVRALCERQGHQVHGGTVRALLSAGGFLRSDGRWFAAPEPADAARRLRRTIVTLAAAAVRPDALENTPSERMAQSVDVRIIPSVVRSRLAEIVQQLRADPGVHPNDGEILR